MMPGSFQLPERCFFSALLTGGLSLLVACAGLESDLARDQERENRGTYRSSSELVRVQNNGVLSNQGEGKDPASEIWEIKETPPEEVTVLPSEPVETGVKSEAVVAEVPVPDVTEAGLPHEEINLLTDVTPFSQEESMSFLQTSCSGCHRPGGAYASFWTLNDTYTASDYSSDTMAARVFQAIYNYATEASDKADPKPMPPGEPLDEQKEKAKRYLSWVVSQLPLIAQEANIRFGNDLFVEGKVTYNYQCKNPMTLRQYLRAVTNDALGREPSTPELEEFSGFLDTTVTGESKKKVVEKLSDPTITWKEEFKNFGLQNFATKFAGASELNTVSDSILTSAVVADLKKEFYQLVRNNYENLDFRSLLLGDIVMVTKNTAPLYACPPPSEENQWAPCQMKGGRSSWFTTVGYLASKPSSFLRVNNNYGRVALMHFAIKGTVFKPATDGPKGEAINPLPSCFKTQDYRGEDNVGQVAPFGSGKVPASGNICQSCHISRMIAPGSLLFRPFAPYGQIISSIDIQNESGFIFDDLQVALYRDDNRKVNQPEAEGPLTEVDKNLLISMLDIAGPLEQACAPGAGKDGQDLILNNIRDLAAYWMGEDGINLAEGLARHLPRAVSNISVTSDEIIAVVKNAWTEGKGKLPAVFESYFLSETYSCAKD